MKECDAPESNKILAKELERRKVPLTTEASGAGVEVGKGGDGGVAAVTA
jgi:hypothetical protein